MRFRRTLALALVSVASCTSASGDVVGGGPRVGYDPTLPAVVEPTYLDAPKLSWTGIYRDYFSRRALSSCAGRTSCHADATGLGAQGSNFVCADKNRCWDSMRHAIDDNRDASVVPLIADSDITAPENAYLFRVLRVGGEDGKGAPDPQMKKMPKVPTDFYFTPDDITRMQTWIRNGAKND